MIKDKWRYEIIRKKDNSKYVVFICNDKTFSAIGVYEGTRKECVNYVENKKQNKRKNAKNK